MKKGPGAKDDKGEKKGKEDEDDMGYRLTTSDFVKQLKAADKTYVGKNIDYLHFCVCTMMYKTCFHFYLCPFRVQCRVIFFECLFVIFSLILFLFFSLKNSFKLPSFKINQLDVNLRYSITKKLPSFYEYRFY
jgi:hypothetical protein